MILFSSPDVGGAIIPGKCGDVKKPTFFGGRVEIFRVLCEKYYPVLDSAASSGGCQAAFLCNYIRIYFTRH